jgi:hypothetical protein
MVGHTDKSQPTTSTVLCREWEASDLYGEMGTTWVWRWDLPEGSNQINPEGPSLAAPPGMDYFRGSSQCKGPKEEHHGLFRDPKGQACGRVL